MLFLEVKLLGLQSSVMRYNDFARVPANDRPLSETIATRYCSARANEKLRVRWRVLVNVDRWLEPPMVLLVLAWLALLIVEFVGGMARWMAWFAAQLS
jgi:hypothetical protein